MNENTKVILNCRTRRIDIITKGSVCSTNEFGDKIFKETSDANAEVELIRNQRYTKEV